MLRIRKKAEETGISLKDAVNLALRRGVEAIGRPATGRSFSCRTYSLGHPPSVDLDRALDLAERLEDEEIARKLELRK